MSPNRDRILEQALKHELRAADVAVTDACLDAETLSAWADEGLDAAAMVAVEAHVSTCARCQALVAAFARGTSAPVAPLAPPLAPLAPSAPGTLSLWRWFLAPLAAGLAAVTLWMVVPEQQQVAVAPPQPVEAKQAQAPRTTEAFTQPAQVPSSPRDQVAERTDKLTADTREARQGSAGNSALKDEDRKEEKVAAPARERQAVADAAVPAAPSAAAPATAAAPPAIAALQKSSRAAAAIEIPTLDPSLGWRIVGDRIERSDNGGTTWTVKRQNSGDGIAAGSAPSNTVGWFVGRAGRVLLTIDSGATFVDISLAESLDLASIAAIDARNASVYAVSGRRFRTDDAGRTWRSF